GSSFFDGWNFFGHFDNLTNGDVNFADMNTAFNSSNPLAFINSAQNAIIKVDNQSTVLPNFKRTSVRLDSVAQYDVGSLLVIDIQHMPFGCSVWPAFFSQDWPKNGEIDIIEGWNKVTQNLMSLHTEPGCTVPQNTAQLGTLSNTDCNAGNATLGCGVAASDQASFGDAFNAGGGGVWATQFDVSGIFIWFWERKNIPDSLSSSSAPKTLDTSSWGMPAASFPSTSCNISQFFGPQTFTLVITLCGDAAGNAGVYNQTCADEPPNSIVPPMFAAETSVCYHNNVVGPGSPRYDDAFFEISYIRAFTTTAGATSTSTTAASATNAPGSATNAPGSATKSAATGSPAAPTATSGTVLPNSSAPQIPGVSPTTGTSSAAITEARPFMLPVLVLLSGLLLGQWFV
ncbi:glycoside hydrolase family 16 protein, partial [Sphaerobolus stellatus SS14]